MATIRIHEGSTVTALVGLYRATVVKNVDPTGHGRLLVSAPGILPAATAWAEACVPYQSKAIPAIGSIVWLQFEAGDASRAVWIGTRP